MRKPINGDEQKTFISSCIILISVFVILVFSIIHSSLNSETVSTIMPILIAVYVLSSLALCCGIASIAVLSNNGMTDFYWLFEKDK